MSKISPTCLPWQTKHDFDIEARTTIIGNVDGEIIDGTTHHTFDFVCATLDDDDDSQSRSVAVANAEFIVRACNTHAALLEAAQAAVLAIKQMDGIIGAVEERDNPWNDVLRQLRAAIKATGDA